MQRRASLVQGLCASFALSQLVIAGCAQPASGGGKRRFERQRRQPKRKRRVEQLRRFERPRRLQLRQRRLEHGRRRRLEHRRLEHGQRRLQHRRGRLAHGGTTGTGGSTSGTGGSNTGTGGSSTGLAGNSGNRACGAPASGDVIADFEEGTNQNVAGHAPGLVVRLRRHHRHADPGRRHDRPRTGRGGDRPAARGRHLRHVRAPLDRHRSHRHQRLCRRSALRSTPFCPRRLQASTSKTRSAYDVSKYDGISFNIKSGSGTAPPIWFELQDTENVPAPDGTAKYTGVDQYNTRGMLLTGITHHLDEGVRPLRYAGSPLPPEPDGVRLLERERRLPGAPLGRQERPRSAVRHLSRSSPSSRTRRLRA